MPNAAPPHRAHAPVSASLLRVRRQAGATAARSTRGPLRYLWASPNTLLGVGLAALAAAGGRLRVVDGVLEAHGPALRWILSHLVPLRGGALAITLGHVVLGRDARALDETRDHERAHVAQCERWGPLFLPAYLLSSVWALVRGRHSYLDNAFEREAFAAERPGSRSKASGPRP
jgi:hypothetical protein